MLGEEEGEETDQERAGSIDEAENPDTKPNSTN